MASFAITQFLNDQLRHLVRVSERSNVHVRVLTYEGTAQVCQSEVVVFFGMADPYPDVVYVETPKGGAYIEQPDTDPMAERYARIWDYA
ncbi:Scr1 family TA system antitoxin-like transcriptional regulator [Allosalinactinospora lopnorensis]|uniref:Scr1 family TA system antitoxin-like transcriptional regulator n=1 Tax=Allosalinactinospora lopnorensis TaxID=1352348 RepID=UPI000623FEBD|nr:Scr1 family TA system antitoxin-like transcriptional regulator [Allosalinactinospora lopnorensis]